MGEIQVENFKELFLNLPKEGRYDLLKNIVESLNKEEVDQLLKHLDKILIFNPEENSHNSETEPKLKCSDLIEFFKTLLRTQRMKILLDIVDNLKSCDSEDLVEIIDTRLDELNSINVVQIESDDDDDCDDDDDDDNDDDSRSSDVVFVDPSITETEEIEPDYNCNRNEMEYNHLEFPAQFLQSSLQTEEDENKFCNLCDKFIKKKGWYKHMNTVHSTQKFSCSLCPNSKFKAKKYWKAHMRNIHKDLNIQFPDGRQSSSFGLNNPGLQCGECKMAFGSAELLKVHLENHHTQTQPHFLSDILAESPSDAEDEDYDEICEIDMGAQSQLFRCNSCNKSFQSSSELKSHEQTAHSSEFAQCPYCLIMTRSLRNHIKFVHMKKFQCELCQKTFSANAKLTRHLESHLRGTNRLHNPNTAQAFQSSLPLSSFANILPKDRPKNIKCDLCGYKCVSTWKLNRHMKAHMKGTNRFSLE